jgi:hypothetical protein
MVPVDRGKMMKRTCKSCKWASGLIVTAHMQGHICNRPDELTGFSRRMWCNDERRMNHAGHCGKKGKNWENDDGQ